jgi:hypothetical protein
MVDNEDRGGWVADMVGDCVYEQLAFKSEMECIGHHPGLGIHNVMMLTHD